MDFFTRFFDVLGFAKRKILIDLLEVFDFFYAKIYLALILFFNFLLWISVFYINFKDPQYFRQISSLRRRLEPGSQSTALVIHRISASFCSEGGNDCFSFSALNCQP
jgi:hypothetical protein